MNCGDERGASSSQAVFSPLRIPLFGYWLECPKCGQNTRHTILHEEAEDGAWLADPTRSRRKGDE